MTFDSEFLQTFWGLYNYWIVVALMMCAWLLLRLYYLWLWQGRVSCVSGIDYICDRWGQVLGRQVKVVWHPWGSWMIYQCYGQLFCIEKWS